MTYNYYQIIKELGLNKKVLSYQELYENILKVYAKTFFDDSYIVKSTKRALLSYDKYQKTNMKFIISDYGINRIALTDAYTYNLPGHQFFKLIKKINKISNLGLDAYSLIRTTPKTSKSDIELYHFVYKKEKYVSNYSGIIESGYFKFDPIAAAIYLTNLRYCFFYVPRGSLLDIKDKKVRFVLLLTSYLLLDEYGFVPTK